MFSGAPLSFDDAFIDRLASRLLKLPPPMPGPNGAVGLHVRPSPVPAAVLISLVLRPEGISVLYTQRSPDLRSHSGQVAFPGGKIDAEDVDAAAAALREANEEVGVNPADARILGFMDTYFTGTNYLITPVVATIEPSAEFVPNPREVHSIFEVPLNRILDADNYGRMQFQRDGLERQTWKIDHDGHRIWGITANLTRLFRDIAMREDMP